MMVLFWFGPYVAALLLDITKKCLMLAALLLYAEKNILDVIFHYFILEL